MCFETKYIMMTLQGHPIQGLDFGTYWKHEWDFLLALNSNRGPVLSCFKDITKHYCFFTPKATFVGHIPQNVSCLRIEERLLTVKLFSKNSNPVKSVKCFLEVHKFAGKRELFLVIAFDYSTECVNLFCAATASFKTSMLRTKQFINRFIDSVREHA